MFKLALIAVLSFTLSAVAAEKRPVVYLRPNTTQLFTELYQAYGLLTPPARTFFENAFYLDQGAIPDILPMQPANQAILNHASQVLEEFHKRVNDFELYVDPSQGKPFFYTAAGSKQLLVALVYGIVMSEPQKKFVFVEEAPFYSGHPNVVTGIFHYPNARFVAFHDPAEIALEEGEVLVEFVTSPNNPDGKMRKPLTEAKILIADFVFVSSAFGDGTGYVDENIQWMKEARAKGKHVFSFNSASKQFGKTGTRCGYIWYPISDPYAASIFKKFYHFIAFSTVAGGTSGLSEFLDLIKAFLDLPDTAKGLRQDAWNSLVKRHELVAKEWMHRYPGSSVVSIPGSPTFFAKMKDARVPQKEAAEVVLEDLDVAVNHGEHMGETNEFIRLNLAGYSQPLVEFLNRLAGQKRYRVQDVFVSSAHACSHAVVCANGEAKTVYFVKPGECHIDADALKGALEIVFSPFIDYETSGVVTVKKTDRSDHPVVVRMEDFSITLKKVDENVHLQWTQTLEQEGRWQMVSLVL